MLGDGGARLLEKINWLPDVYHLNESHALPQAFHLYKRYNNLEEVKKRLVITNHTPEPGGNERKNILLLQKLGFFCDISLDEVIRITQIENDLLDHTLTTLRLAGRVNGVSKLHHQSLYNMWERFEDSRKLIAITNAQSFSYWSDAEMYKSLTNNDDEALVKRKKQCKQI